VRKFPTVQDDLPTHGVTIVVSPSKTTIQITISTTSSQNTCGTLSNVSSSLAPPKLSTIYKGKPERRRPPALNRRQSSQLRDNNYHGYYGNTYGGDSNRSSYAVPNYGTRPWFCNCGNGATSRYPANRQHFCAPQAARTSQPSTRFPPNRGRTQSGVHDGSTQNETRANPRQRSSNWWDYAR
jgi:hypothetical protein